MEIYIIKYFSYDFWTLIRSILFLSMLISLILSITLSVSYSEVKVEMSEDDEKSLNVYNAIVTFIFGIQIIAIKVNIDFDTSHKDPSKFLNFVVFSSLWISSMLSIFNLIIS